MKIYFHSDIEQGPRAWNSDGSYPFDTSLDVWGISEIVMAEGVE